MPEPTPLARD